MRRIFGCSFLPDFDYGKGGRGWRDLWQDCLGLILNNPREVRQLLINNFAGVRIDGSNATIIGKRHGEFVADRNGIPRVWMDHGIWPLITLELYLNETGDFDILFEAQVYFRNFEVCRSREIDRSWNLAYGQHLKTTKGVAYKGSILEHLLVENLVQFFNVGSHNHVRLEGADWNDGLDMAREHGESVAFSAMYAHNLNLLADILLKTGWETIGIAREIKILLKEFNYDESIKKHGILKEYFDTTKMNLSGVVVDLDTTVLAHNLRMKAEWMIQHIRKTEWLKEGFFNGYYDNHKERVEGKKHGYLRMSLTSQVFPIISGTARKEEIKAILRSARKYLFDLRLQGYHLNTDFKEEQYQLGRAFSFVYGEKENGAVFSHMVVMFAYALYTQGFVDEGWQVLSSIYKMACNSRQVKPILVCRSTLTFRAGGCIHILLVQPVGFFLPY